jgi:hypothetical protein
VESRSPQDGKVSWKSEEQIRNAIGARPVVLRILRNHPITLTFDENVKPSDMNNEAGKNLKTMGVVLPEGKLVGPEVGLLKEFT